MAVVTFLSNAVSADQHDICLLLRGYSFVEVWYHVMFDRADTMLERLKESWGLF